MGVKQRPNEHEIGLFKKAQEFVSYIRWIPGLRMVTVSNTLAMYATHPGSDIDLFVITAPNRLWLVRTLVLIMATMLGVRTKTGDEAGKFCFPFFITERALNLKPLTIENDIYFAYWISTLKPVWIDHYAYGRLMEINASWVSVSDEQIKANRAYLLPNNRRISRSTNPFSPLLDTLDTILHGISLPRIEARIKTLGAKTEGIYISEDVLKLHYEDRREEWRERVSEK